MARPSTYDFDLCKEVCAQVAEGKNIKEVLNSKDEYPTFQTWCNWKREHNELFDLYIKSIQDKADSVDAQIDEIWEGCRLGQYDASTANVLIQTLKWKASKYYPKMFGDKVQQEISGEIKTENKQDLSKLSDAELLQLKALYARINNS
jgi:hypothetical protein